jgi:LSD1 subclass zinc finger protein
MKSAQLQTLQCLSCGRPLNPPEGAEEIVCEHCGEVFDLRGFTSMELELEEFDKILLYALKRKRFNSKSNRVKDEY